MNTPLPEEHIKILLTDNLYLNCFACGSSFNTKSLKPEDFILNCMHFRCQLCSSLNKPCRLDETISKFKADQNEIQYFLNSNPDLKDSRCSTHNLPEECYCKSCHKLICYRCITFHKTHDIFDESQLSDLVQDYKTSFNSKLKESLLTMNEKSIRVINLQEAIKKSKTNMKKLRLKLAEELIRSRLNYENRLAQEKQDFKKLNQFWLDKFRKIFNDCTLLKDIVVKGRTYLQKKKDFLEAAEKDQRLLFIDGALDIELINFQSISFTLDSLPHNTKPEYASPEELRWLYLYSNNFN